MTEYFRNESDDSEFDQITSDLVLPEWLMAYEDMQEAQDAFDRAGDSNAVEVMNYLNEVFEQTGLPWTRITVTGRLQADGELEEDDEEDEGDNFIDAAEFICGPISVRLLPQDDGSERLVVGLELIEVDEWVDDENFAKETALFIAKDDIFDIQFQHETLGMKGQWIMNHHPEVYHALVESFSIDTSDVAAVVAALKKFSVNTDNPELLHRVGPILYDWLKFDTAPYKAAICGLLKTVDFEGDQAAVEYEGELSCLYVEGVIMAEQREDGAYEPLLACRMPAEDKEEDGFIALAVPARSLVALEPHRSSHAAIEALRPYAFDDAETVAPSLERLYGWSDVIEEREDDGERALLDQTERIIEAAAHYDVGGFYTFDITSEIDQLRYDYKDHLEAHLAHEATMDDDVVAAVLSKLQKDTEKLEDVRFGETWMQTQHDGFVIDENGESVDCIGGDAVRGVATGLKVLRLSYVGEGEGIAGEDAHAAVLAIKLSDARLVAQSGEQHSVFMGDSCYVPLMEHTQLARVVFRQQP